jgi:hypothetical protein
MRPESAGSARGRPGSANSHLDWRPPIPGRPGSANK